MYPEENFSKNRFFIYEELVRENFHFLIERYGFKIFNIKMLQGQYILIRYLSENVFVDLYYSSPGFELDFCLGRVGIDEQPEGNNITSSDIVLMNEYERYARYKLYSAHSYENLAKGLPKLANLLESHGDEFLKGNFQCYEEVLLKKKEILINGPMIKRSNRQKKQHLQLLFHLI